MSLTERGRWGGIRVDERGQIVTSGLTERGLWVNNAPYKYLDMDGIDDYISTPSMTYDEVIFDMSVNPTAFYKTVLINSLGNYRLIYDEGYYIWYFESVASWNGVNVGDSGSFTIPADTRGVWRMTKDSQTASNSLFANAGGGANMRGKLYRATFKLAGVVVADYDMTTGTVQDQSGNGQHATLTGGTFVAEGIAGDPTGSATLQSVATFAASGVATLTGAATFQGVATITANPKATRAGAVTFQGVAQMSVTGTVTVPHIISDTFTRAFATTLDTSDTGQSWEIVYGQLGTNGNGEAIASFDGFGTAVIDAGTSELDVRLTNVQPNDFNGIVFRATGSTDPNFLKFFFDPIGGYALGNWLFGSMNIIAYSSLSFASAFDVMRVKAFGSHIKCYVNDIEVIDATVTAYQTATYVGFSVQEFGMVDNFTADQSTAFTEISGAATLRGVGTFAPAGKATRTGAATFQGVGTITASGSPTGASGATLQGVATFTAGGVATLAGAASMQAVATFTVNPIASITRTASFQAVGTLTSNGAQYVFASTSFQGVGRLVPSGIARSTGAATFQGAATFTALGGFPIFGATTLRGVMTLVTAGAFGKASLDVIYLSGDRILSVRVTAEKSMAINLDGDDQTSVSIQGRLPAPISLRGDT